MIVPSPATASGGTQLNLLPPSWNVVTVLGRVKTTKVFIIIMSISGEYSTPKIAPGPGGGRG